MTLAAWGATTLKIAWRVWELTAGYWARKVFVDEGL